MNVKMVRRPHCLQTAEIAAGHANVSFCSPLPACDGISPAA